MELPAGGSRTWLLNCIPLAVLGLLGWWWDQHLACPRGMHAAWHAVGALGGSGGLPVSLEHQREAVLTVQHLAAFAYSSIEGGRKGSTVCPEWGTALDAEMSGG